MLGRPARAKCYRPESSRRRGVSNYLVIEFEIIDET